MTDPDHTPVTDQAPLTDEELAARFPLLHRQKKRYDLERTRRAAGELRAIASALECGGAVHRDGLALTPEQVVVVVLGSDGVSLAGWTDRGTLKMAHLVLSGAAWGATRSLSTYLAGVPVKASYQKLRGLRLTNRA